MSGSYRDHITYSSMGLNAYEKLKNSRFALVMFEHALRLRPKNETSLLMCGIFNLLLGNYEKAKLYFDTIITEINPNYALAYYNRAGYYVQKGMYDKAIENLSQAIRLDQSMYKAYYSRAEIYLKQDNYTKGMEDLEVVMQKNPSFSAAFYVAAQVQAKLNNIEEARTLFEKAILLKPEYVPAYGHYVKLLVGQAQINSADYTRALELYSKVIQLEPEKAGHYIARAQLYYKGLSYEKGDKDYEYALKLAPQLQSVHSESMEFCRSMYARVKNQDVGGCRLDANPMTKALVEGEKDTAGLFVKNNNLPPKALTVGEKVVQFFIQDIWSYIADFFVWIGNGFIEVFTPNVDERYQYNVLTEKTEGEKSASNDLPGCDVRVVDPQRYRVS